MARFFRVLAGDAVYEQVRSTLDAAWGLPNSTGTETCIDRAAVAPRDSQGRILLAVNDAFCEWEPASTMLPQLLAGGACEEITADAYAPDPQPTP